MPPPSQENDPPSHRKSSWWNPNRGSWRSPWSLNDDQPAEKKPAKSPPSAPKKPSATRGETQILDAILRQPTPSIAPKSQPQIEPRKTVAAVAEPAAKVVVQLPEKPPPSTISNTKAAVPEASSAPVAPSLPPSPVAVEGSAPPGRHDIPIAGWHEASQGLVLPPVTDDAPQLRTRLPGGLVAQFAAPAPPLAKVDTAAVPEVPRVMPAPMEKPQTPIALTVPPLIAEERELEPRHESNGSGEPARMTPFSAVESRAPEATQVVAGGNGPSSALSPLGETAVEADVPATPSPVPVFRPRRVQPPKAQPPPESSRAAPAPQPTTAREPARQTRPMANPPPGEVIVIEPEHQPVSLRDAGPAPRVKEQRTPEAAPDIPSQIGEWPPRRPRTTHSHAWGRLLTFSLVVFVFTVLTWIYWQDENPPSEETLQLKRDFDDTQRATALNRMRTLLTSVAPVQSAAQVGVPPWHWPQPDLARMVEANGVARENLRDLLEEPDWHPRSKAWFEEDIGIHGAWTTLAILKQAEAAYLMRRGEEEAAFTAAIDLAEVARSLQELHAWPSYYDRSLQIFERSSQTLADLLKTTKLDAVRLGVFQEEYLRCKPSDEVLRAAMSAWFLFEKKLMLGAESREPDDSLPGGVFFQRPGRLFFKPNRTLKLFALSFHDLRDEAENSPHSRSSQINLRLGRMGSTVGLPNSAGEAYFASRIAPYVSLPDRQSIAHAQHAVVSTLFAIRRHRADSGLHRLPPKLLNLRPDYLTDLPVDPFSGEALKYDFANGVVTSVGTNFTLDGGRPADPPLSDPREISAQAGMDP